MERILPFSLFLFLLFPFHSSALPAFPGAEGWGAETPGGRGGKVVQVTNLNSSGAGSLRAAMLTTGPRIIVFRVSGVIPLQTKADGSFGWYMEADNLSNLTIAGQTSPGGITLTSEDGFTGSLVNQYSANKWHDGVFRHLRFRSKRSNEGTIGLYLSHHFIFDHCDFSGGGDETLDCSRCNNFTIQWCTIANSGPDGQVYGALIGYDPNYHITMHHNLFANHQNRGGPEMAWFQVPPDDGMVDYRNNVCYNSATYFLIYSVTQSLINTHVVNNYFKDGPITALNGWFFNMVSLPGAKAYHGGNYFDARPGDPGGASRIHDLSGRVDTTVSTPFNMPAVTTETAQQAYQSLITKGGALPRDPMNTRTFGQLQNRTGALGKTDDALITTGPLPPDDADLDGMADCWENAMGFNPGSATDNVSDHDGDGYTNVEEYINDLALDLEGATPQNFPLDQGCPTGIEAALAANRAPSLAIHPNPLRAGSSALIPLPVGPGIDAVQIYDAAGKQVADLSSQVESRKGGALLASWNTAGLPNGLYLVKIRAGANVRVGRVVVNR